MSHAVTTPLYIKAKPSFIRPTTFCRESEIPFDPIMCCWRSALLTRRCGECYRSNALSPEPSLAFSSVDSRWLQDCNTTCSFLPLPPFRSAVGGLWFRSDLSRVPPHPCFYSRIKGVREDEALRCTVAFPFSPLASFFPEKGPGWL